MHSTNADGPNIGLTTKDAKITRRLRRLVNTEYGVIWDPVKGRIESGTIEVAWQTPTRLVLMRTSGLACDINQCHLL
jgi:hypothetical protein